TTNMLTELFKCIDHPCCSCIYLKLIHHSPATTSLADQMHVVIECELAVRVAKTFEPRATPYTRDEVRAAVAEVMPAFELIEDRNADYKSSKATSDRKSTRLNSSHVKISYAVFCLKKKKT